MKFAIGVVVGVVFAQSITSVAQTRLVSPIRKKAMRVVGTAAYKIGATLMDLGYEERR